MPEDFAAPEQQPYKTAIAQPPPPAANAPVTTPYVTQVPEPAAVEAILAKSPVAPADTPPSAIQAATVKVQALLKASLGSRYQVLGADAIGGMATIVRLRHRIHGGACIAKVLHEHLAESPYIVAAFHREMGFISQLAGHPGIVPVTDAYLSNSLHCIIMPFVEGEDLDQILLHRGKFSRDEALTLLAQLSSLLMYTETLGIAHCDLSPANIRLDSFGHYRLLDFGLARSKTQPAQEQQQLAIAGTPAYTSPEQLRGQQPDSRSDLYAAGAILAEVLLGTPLFQAATLEELAEKHLAGAYVLSPELEADIPLAALIRSLLATDPAQRMGSAFELSGAISAMGFDVPATGRMIQGTPVKLPSTRRRRLQPAL